MTTDRRHALLAALATGLGAAGMAAESRAATGARREAPSRPAPADRALAPDGQDQTEALQKAIDTAAPTGTPVVLAPGRYLVRTLHLRSGTRLIGASGATVLAFAGGSACLEAKGARDVRLDGLVLDGGLRPLAGPRTAGLVALADCPGLVIRDLDIRDSLASGISLAGCSGVVSDCRIERVAEAAIFSIDAAGLEIRDNRIERCGNNGILVWRSAAGEDGTIVSGNRIARVSADAGGSGQNGNGINVYRAAGVLVSANRITDCAFTAVRGNAASDIQIVANSCARLGEVALYAEFGFEGALIASNVVDGAATGISVTNFNEGGRLAVVQGNLVRNLVRREHEPVDKRGDGICVEADATVTGNTVEGAPACGIMVGWGKWMRDVNVGSNLVRNARIGIGISSDASGGHVLVAQNLISGAKDGAIRALDRGRPHGPDLARTKVESARVAISGNVAT